MAGRDMHTPPDLGTLTYDAQQFSRVFKTPLGRSLWAMLTRPDIVIRCETAAMLGRSPVEVLSPLLIWTYGADALDMQVKQMIGHMLRQIMDALGYAATATERRIPGAGVFATGARYVADGAGTVSTSMRASDREAWALRAPTCPFTAWLHRETQDSQGAICLQRLGQLAARFNIDQHFPALSPAQQRMAIGTLLRARVPPDLYG